MGEISAERLRPRRNASPIAEPGDTDVQAASKLGSLLEFVGYLNFSLGKEIRFS